MKKINQSYIFNNVENNKNTLWKKAGFFTYDKNSTQPVFSILMPPPNITGRLHLGHAWDLVLQDFSIRSAKLQGYNVNWIPAIDHAGIATQIKVEHALWQQKQQTKWDIGRTAFLKVIWEHVANYKLAILKQWNQLGLAINYNKIGFTLDQEFAGTVQTAFQSLYKKGLIYQGERIISWDPHLETALSDIQIEHRPVQGELYYIKYRLLNADGYLPVATTRPETMFADQCLVVNTNDARYKEYHNQKVINPANNQVIPVITDDYVDPMFGTGVMKCTPAHDFNDFIIGKRHNLKFTLCIDKKGHMNDVAGPYANQDRFTCRKNLIADFQKQNILIKQVHHAMNVAYSIRSGAVIEPMLSKQWFIKSSALAPIIKKWQNSDKAVQFYPRRFHSTLNTWLDNLEDWCISRQIWWGHRIPVWYHKKTHAIHVGTEPSDLANYTQDSSVLDTWFSSSLWPLVAATHYYQKADNSITSSLLVSGYDILFFWITRMMQQAIVLKNAIPFKKVLLHGLIRDEHGKKMSKSLDNGIDPQDVIDEYGNDALRLWLLTNSKPGLDLNWSALKVREGAVFLNKVWNAARYVSAAMPNQEINLQQLQQILEQEPSLDINEWVLSKLAETSEQYFDFVNNKYNYVLGFKILKDFILNVFCDWYIELSKSFLNQTSVQYTLAFCLQTILMLLNPYAPFITEEIYQSLFNAESIYQDNYQKCSWKQPAHNYVPWLIEVITQIRKIRKTKMIAKREPLYLNFHNRAELNDQEHALSLFLTNAAPALKLMTNTIVVDNHEHLSDYKNIIFSSSLATMNVAVARKALINESVALYKQLKNLQKEVARSQATLANSNFMAKASPQKIALEQKKFAKYQKQLKDLQKVMHNFNN